MLTYCADPDIFLNIESREVYITHLFGLFNVYFNIATVNFLLQTLQIDGRELD
jgi:hypothetical protein